MSYKFKKEYIDWTEYRKLPDLEEVDFHWAGSGQYHDYDESMENVYSYTIGALRQAQLQGKKYVLFTHGSSTSRPGKKTARSQVRKAMQSSESTPYIIRKNSIQHPTVFVAAIDPLSDSNNQQPA